jgi:3-hydroxy acid dehydrogenase/malonic semialdehyde reductase
MKKKIALITGATSGIGKSTALILAKNGYSIIATGRRKEKLEELRQELVDGVDYLPLDFDVRDRQKVSEILGNLPEDWKAIDILVNNAGNAHGIDPIQSGNLDDWDAMMDINVKGLLYVTKAIVPGMCDRKSGMVINIGSIAGKESYPNGSVYCGSKAAVDAITKGMRMDLNPFGIRVVAIHPGLVETEFSMVRFKGDESKSEKVYQGFKPLVAQDIAEIIEFVVNRPSHVVLADIVVLPTAQASATIVNRNLKS